MKSLILRAAWGVVVAGGLVACVTEGADSEEPTAPTSAASKTVGSAGGTIVTSDGTQIQIPAGALPSDVAITITPAADLGAPEDTELVGTPFIFGPDGTTFTKPVTVILPFDPAKLPAGRKAEEILIFTAPGKSTEFTSLGGKPFDATHVQATTLHFSSFAPVVPAGAPIKDAGADAPTDAKDASVDAPHDSPTDAPKDGATDAKKDGTSVDAATDAGSD